MGWLKRMEVDYPLIDSIFLDFCFSHSIFTLEDFLLYDVNALTTFALNQPNPHRLKQGIDQLLAIVDGLHRPWLNGVELMKDARENKQTLSLAYQGEGFVTELVGPSSSGKTQVCLHAVASVAKGDAGHVVFIDSGNSFSAARIVQLVNRSSYSASKQDNNEAFHNIMNSIMCNPVFDIFSLFEVLHQLALKLKNQMCSVKLLIVDSFSSLIIPLLGGSGPYGHALMTSAGNLLKKIAYEYSITVLVTNHMVAGEGGSAKPALGESWKSIPHARFLLSLDRENNTCTISVIRHPSMAVGNQVKFRIYDS